MTRYFILVQEFFNMLSFTQGEGPLFQQIQTLIDALESRLIGQENYEPSALAPFPGKLLQPIRTSRKIKSIDAAFANQTLLPTSLYLRPVARPMPL